jgi:hypothetical protein
MTRKCMVRDLPGSGIGVGGKVLMCVSLPRLSVVHMQRRGSVLALLVAAAILLELAAGVGLA